MSELDRCFKEGLLRLAKPNPEKAKRELAASENKIGSAEAVAKVGVFDLAIVSAYTAMFHAARALLFKDGIEERSHYGLFVYVREKYTGKLPMKFINELNAMRMARHDVLYEIEPSERQEVEAESAILVAKEFLKIIKSLLNNKT